MASKDFEQRSGFEVAIGGRMQVSRSAVAVSLLLSSSSFSPAQADDLSNVVDQTQQLQKQIQSTGVENPCPAVPAATLLSCYNQVCTQDLSNPSYETMVAQVQADGQKLYDSDIGDFRSPLTSWLVNTAKVMTLERNTLSNSIASGKTAVDPKFALLHNVSLLANTFDQAVFKEGSTLDHLILDEPATRAKLSTLPKREQDWLIQAIPHFYQLPGVQDSMESGDNSVADLLKQKYPDLSFKDAVQKEATEFQSSYTAARATAEKLGFPASSFDELYPKGLVEGLQHGQRMDEASLEQLMQAASQRELLEMIGHPEKTTWLAGRNPGDLSALVKSADVAKKVALLKDYAASPAFQSTINTIAGTCLATYSLNHASLPTQNQLDDGKKSAQEVQDLIKTRLFSKLSQHTASMLEGVFKNSQTFFPGTFDEFKSDFISGLQGEANAAVDELQYDQTHTGAAAQQGALFNIYDFIGKDWTPENYVKMQFQYCDGFQAPGLSDRANQSEAVFWSSWASLKNPRFGKAVMAHEMGHIVETALLNDKPSIESAQKFKGIEDCLAGKHPESATAAVSVPLQAESDGKSASFLLSYKQYNVEDFADLVSAISIPDTNVGCGLMSSKDLQNLSVVNADSADTHSGDFYRVLQIEAIQKGKIPTVCTEALAAAGMSRDFTACFK